MKKILLSLFVFIILFSFSDMGFASTEITSTKEISRRIQLVEKVGYKLLNANKIDKRIVFVYDHDREDINAHATYFGRTVVVHKGLMDVIQTEDELASVLGHEISHALDYYRGIFRGTFTRPLFKAQARKAETKADLRSVDFVVNAGYNPVAAIIISNKVFPQNRYEWCSSHPLASRRLAMIYQHIYVNYPYFLVNNSYAKHPVYQNFLLTSKENRMLLKNELEKTEKYDKKLNKPSYK